MSEAMVFGAGLAGCEAAWQIAQRGISVTLVEMKPVKRTAAHTSDNFAELVCSNSLRSAHITNAVGLLKEEMRRLGSLVIRAADANKVPAGSALAVDREGFSFFITEAVKGNPLITVETREATEIDESMPTIIATGPLTQGALCEEIVKLVGRDALYFYDAAAPILHADSIDMDIAFRASRFDEGSDYINCPMSKEEYFDFYRELISAETAEVQGFEDKKVFEGCMPVETMAKRGEMTLAFGPLKPIGLIDPRTGKRPFANVQLRQDDREGRLFNIVGFQTRLKHPEQKRVFSMIPGLKSAVFARYGVMHRNFFIHSPGILDANYRLKARPNLFFAGQLTGVEGYVESASSGLLAGMSLACQIRGVIPPLFSDITAIGALARYVSSYAGRDFQPMNVNFGIIAEGDRSIRSKRERYAAVAERSLCEIDKTAKELGGFND